ncbi:SLBB domain-containing protein [Sphingomonas sp. Mn802worker]|uniref:SLBB domain-containing protein n=1 Tax=Sphingomonas sp. Mn802worker TaxID=629773 RepID=UPI00039C836E|nr:SLBB domain-containing protein [Sphingomonas sp. Mn802worker]
MMLSVILPGGRVRSRAVLRRTACLAALITVSNPVSAQQYDTTGRNLPSGSPLGSDTQGQQQTGQSQQSQSSYPLPAERVGPTQIEDNSASSSAQLRGENTLDETGTTNARGLATNRQQTLNQLPVLPPPPNDFERFVQQRLGRVLPRFGTGLIVPSSRTYSVPTTTTVPASYKLAPGDEIFIGLSGSIEGSVSRQIDSNGRVFLPRVGQINLAGVSYGDLKDTIVRAVGIRYRGFNVSVAVTRLRGIRVFVTGFANNPGSYTVDSLSTLVNAIFAAGGPSAGGSFRSVRLIRNGETISDFDLYGFLRNGDRSRDEVLQNGDVLYIAPLGEQVALTGSVNQEGIYEAKPGESLDELLRFAGGATALADPDRLILYKLSNANTVGGVQVGRDSYAAQPVTGGDIVQILAKGTLATPLERQTVVVRIEGEVNKPGNYVVQPGSSFEQVLALAGGTTPRAYLYGTNFQRVSVRRQQRESYEEALRQLEVTLAGAPLTTDTTLSAEQAAAQNAAGRALLERLRQQQPDGRIVLPVEPDGSGLPTTLALENNDTIIVPPRSSTVGVFGAVYRPASFLVEGQRRQRVRDYLDQAGGTLRLADTRDIFVVHANGAVVSKRSGALSQYVLPGDIVFVPTKTQNVSLLSRIAQISSILFQGALSAATVVAVTR